MAVILADTSALYALLDRRDQNHQDAIQFYERIPSHTQLIIIEYVLVELMTLLRKRGYTSFAVQFRESLPTSRVFTLKYSSPELENVPVFSFDHHIAQMGLVRLP